MPFPAIDRLRQIKTLPQLVGYLRNELDWPINSNNTEEITFDYEPSELGLDKETAVRVKEIKQLRPLTGNQPWGIFFVNFEKKRLVHMVTSGECTTDCLKIRVPLKTGTSLDMRPSSASMRPS